MEEIEEDLAPWRALREATPGTGRSASLQEQVLGQVVGVDALAVPDGATVFVAGDWHGNAAFAAAAVRRASRAGARLVLQLGDFGFWPGAAGEGYLDVLELTCRQEQVTVCWLDGNHEDHSGLPRYPLAPGGTRPVRPHVWHLPRGHRWAWSGTTWAAVGGAVSVDRALRVPGRSWWPGETLTTRQAEAVAAAGPADVLLCHDRPAMVAAARGQTPGSWHDRAPRAWARGDLVAADAHAALLQEVVDAVRPSRLFHGHLHERYDLVVDPTPWAGRCHVTALGDDSHAAGNGVIVDVDRPLDPGDDESA